MRDLYLDVNNYALPQTSDMRHVTAGTLVPSSVNGDIEIQWEWSNFDPSQNPNPLTDYDKTLHKWFRPWDEHVTQNCANRP